MQKWCMWLLALLSLASCSSDDSTYHATGIGSVELNDSVFAIHYYSSTLLLQDDAIKAGLTDSSRVFFSGEGRLVSEADGSVYDFTPSFISADVTVPVLMLDSVGMSSDSLSTIASSADGFYAQNIHITRDWRRNDFFDATAIYPGHDDGAGDFFGLVGDTLSADADTLRLWLRLHRQKKDTTNMITRHISVPVNCLRDSAKERLLIRLSRINAAGDTVVSDMVYSYVNFIE